MLSIGIGGMSSFFLDLIKLQSEIAAHKKVAEKQDLQQLIIPIKEFAQQNDKDELWNNGRLYDVSSYVIINDYAIVWAYQDQQEECIVNIIIGNYEQIDQNNSDNTRHISQHHSTAPDGKILTTPYVIGFVGVSAVHYPLSPSVKRYSPVYSGVIKPPPECKVS